MPLPVRSHPDTAAGTEPIRVLYDVITASASGDPYLEFPPEEPAETVVQQCGAGGDPYLEFPPEAPEEPAEIVVQQRGAGGDAYLEFPPEAPEEPAETVVQQRVFSIEPISREPPRYEAQRRPQDQLLGRAPNVPAGVGLVRTSFRRIAPPWTRPRFLRLLHPRRVLLALRRSVVGTLSAGRRGVEGTYAVARWTRSSCVGLIERTTSIGISGVSRFRRFGGEVTTRGHAIWRFSGVATILVRARLTRDIRTIEGVMSMVGRRLSVMSRSLHEQCRGSLRVLVRSAHQVALARQPLGIRVPLWALKISRVRVPVMNVTLVAITGATAVGALVMWFFGVQATLPTLTDRGAVVPPDAAAPPDVVVSEPFADDYVATVGIMPLEQQGTATAPPSVSAPMIVMSAAMTVMSTPEGARVTVDGIGWGETPVTIRDLPPGPKVVRLTKEGYVSQQRIVSVPDDRRPSAVQVTLRARN